MVAGDPSQTTPVQITHVFFVLCCCTQIGCVEQHKTKKTCVICTDVVWLLSPAVAIACLTLMKQFVSLLHGMYIKVQQT